MGVDQERLLRAREAPVNLPVPMVTEGDKVMEEVEEVLQVMLADKPVVQGVLSVVIMEVRLLQEEQVTLLQAMEVPVEAAQQEVQEVLQEAQEAILARAAAVELQAAAAQVQ